MLVKRKRRKGPGQEGLITASPFLMPSLIGLLVFSLLPLLISAFISLTDWNGLDQLTAPGFFQEHFIGLDNYKAILSSPEFWGVLWNTFRYIIMYIPLMLVASLGVALSAQPPAPRRNSLPYHLLYPGAHLLGGSLHDLEVYAIPGVWRGQQHLGRFRYTGAGWLLDEAWAMPAIVLVSVWKDMGFFGLILLSGMVGINKSYYEAASLDGAGSWQKFWKITLPLMTPAIFYVLIVSLINAFQLFPQIMIMTDGGPNGATQVMVERIYKYGFRYYRMGYAAAFSWILFAIIMVCTAIQMKGQERWVNYDS